MLVAECAQRVRVVSGVVCECCVHKGCDGGGWVSSLGSSTSPRTAFLVCLVEGTGGALLLEVEDGGRQ